jgi:hypothetical protein
MCMSCLECGALPINATSCPYGGCVMPVCIQYTVITAKHQHYGTMVHYAHKLQSMVEQLRKDVAVFVYVRPV